MTEPLKVNPHIEGAESSEDSVRANPNSRSWSFVAEHLPRRIPLFIPRDQAYYWSWEWQQGIRRSMADLEAGNYTDYSPDDSGAITRRFVGEED